MRELTGLVMPKKYWVRTGETVKDLRAIFSNRSFKHSPALQGADRHPLYG
jgi:hypothetical protein